MARFWNPGFKWDDTLKFDNPTADDNSSNISYYRITAEAKSFFEVKDTQTIKLPTGEEYEIPLRFKELIRVQYAERGVVLVAPGEHSEFVNIAATEEEAKSKGNAIWKQYTTNKCNEWFGIVEEVRAAGRLPQPAQGLFKRCLEERGIADPADVATGLAKAREGQQENKDLQAQLADALNRINRLEGAKSAKGA